VASFVGNAGNWVRRVDWGELYRGELQDGRPVAIMCLNQEEPTKEKRFLTEIEINTCLSHANIVPLIGYCVEKAHLILVYDFLPEGTLDDHLHGTRTGCRNPSHLLEESSKSLKLVVKCMLHPHN
jgi:hypothetical protein